MGEANCAALPGHCLEAYGTSLVELVVLMGACFLTIFFYTCLNNFIRQLNDGIRAVIFCAVRKFLLVFIASTIMIDMARNEMSLQTYKEISIRFRDNIYLFIFYSS